MMISYPYMVFRIRYNVSDWVTYRDGESYLFYDTLQRQLYELPTAQSRQEVVEQWDNPIRYLARAKPLGPKITIQNPYDFAHNKEVGSIIGNIHPKKLQRYGSGKVLIVSHERDEINYHTSHWSARCAWNERCMRRKARPGYSGWGWDREVRHPCEIYDSVNRKLIVAEDVSERGCSKLNSMVPQYWRKRQVYEFRTVQIFNHNPYFLITEIKLENDGRSKRGRLSYWKWANFWGTAVIELKNQPIRMAVDRTDEDHGVLYINDEVQRTPQELLDTLNFNLAVPLAERH